MLVHLRWMIRRDMPEVANIEQESFEFPWSEEDFVRTLRRRTIIGMVAEDDRGVWGFAIYELLPKRIHILNMAVAHSCRRCGVGRQIVEKLIKKLSQHRRTRLSLEVRETNLVAQKFFQSLGFKATGVLRDYYEDSPEDAYKMVYTIKVEEHVEMF